MPRKQPPVMASSASMPVVMDISPPLLRAADPSHHPVFPPPGGFGVPDDAPAPFSGLSTQIPHSPSQLPRYASSPSGLTANPASSQRGAAMGMGMRPSPSAPTMRAVGPGASDGALPPFRDQSRGPSPAPPATVGQGGRRYPPSMIAPVPVHPTGRGGYDEYDMTSQPSPTHAYLEAFNSPPPQQASTTTAGPGGLAGGYMSPYGSARGFPGMAPSPSPSSPGLDATEKDPLDAHAYAHSPPAEFGSNHYLSPRGYPSREDRGSQSSAVPVWATPAGGAPAGMSALGSSEKPYKAPRKGCLPSNPKKRRWVIFGVPALLLLLAAGAGVGVYFGVFKNKKTGTSTGSGGSSGGTGTGTGTGGGGNGGASMATSGTNGSTVTTDAGLTFTYVNNFGGSWAQDPSRPYSVSGRAQSWSPTVNEPWIWGQHIIRGVNLGGWLVTEPFIVPGLYEPYQNATPFAQDEYTLSQAMGADLATLMEQHYSTFITEVDFADIASKGLNWVRIPIGYWAIETNANDPYLPKVSWQYFLKAVGWGRKYGIRILLDFHALPGSQNGWNHSGKGGVVNWMFGVMGIANAQRSMEHLRSMTQFLSQDGIKQVVPMLGLVNEVPTYIVGSMTLRSFYYQAYNMIRSITGYGAGNGPIIAIHEGFEGIGSWQNFMLGADRIALDQHPYLAFGDQNLASHVTQSRIPCGWGGGTNDSQTNFGITIGGEWSNAINNCGKWLNGVFPPSSGVSAQQGSYNTLAGGQGCAYWENYPAWSADLKAGIMQYTLASMDGLQNWFFWTWKIGVSSDTGRPTSPMWHYKLGVEQGWMPSDPRVASGFCRSMGIAGNQFNGVFPAVATGGIPTAAPISNTSAIAVFPPTSLGPSFTANQIALFPTLTRTGPPITLPMPTHLPTVSVGSGWGVAADSQGAYVSVAGCNYPNQYDATALSNLPAAVCTGTRKRDAMPSVPTPAPTA